MIRPGSAGDLHITTSRELHRGAPLKDKSQPALNAPSALKIIGAVTSQTAVIGALLFYFGWVRTHAFADYFGIDPTLVSYGTTDYVLRSVNVAFPPLIGAACVALIMLGAHRAFILPMLERSKRNGTWHILRRLIVTAQVSATAVVALVAIGVLLPAQFGVPLGMILPLSLIAATVLIGYAKHLLVKYPALHTRMLARTGNGSFRLQKLVLSTVGLLAVLWAVALYANQIGTQLATTLAARLSAEPAVTLYSTDRIAISGPGVQIAEINEPGTKYHFQYNGTRLLARSDDKFLLIPVNWQRGQDRIFLVRDNESVRIDITAH